MRTTWRTPSTITASYVSLAKMLVLETEPCVVWASGNVRSGRLEKFVHDLLWKVWESFCLGFCSQQERDGRVGVTGPHGSFMGRPNEIKDVAAVTEEAYYANALYSLQKLKVEPPTVAPEGPSAFTRIYDEEQKDWLSVPKGLWQPVKPHTRSGTNGDELKARDWFNDSGVYRSFPIFNIMRYRGVFEGIYVPGKKTDAFVDWSMNYKRRLVDSRTRRAFASKIACAVLTAPLWAPYSGVVYTPYAIFCAVYDRSCRGKRERAEDMASRNPTEQPEMKRDRTRLAPPLVCGRD